MIKQLVPIRLLPLIMLLCVAGAHAENYESCLTHSSAAYLEAFISELDKRDIPHVSVVTDGKTAVCVLPSNEEAVLEISKELAKNNPNIKI